jgi:hypothetical protein
MLDRRAWIRAARLLSWLGVVAAIVFTSRPAHAYPWMIRHEYQGCVPCHSDPSGAGMLTEYGRAMGENILRTRYGTPAPDEPPVYSRFLFGVPTPDWLLLGGSVRNGVWWQSNPQGAPNWEFLQMEADLRAEVKLSRFRASGTIGWNWKTDRSAPAQITDFASNNLVSREHWVGVDLGDDKQFLLRAGRINLPFGIRDDNHELLVRSDQTTRTNINDSQQDGIALAYNGTKLRGEVMALLGNYQINPDVVRERGYSGYLELSLAPWAALGVSSLVTYARYDYQSLTPHTIRQLHGLFARVAPKEPLVILTEVDAVVTTSDVVNGLGGTSPGVVGMVEADVEPTQGVHLMATGEAMVQGNVPLGTGPAPPVPGTARSFDGWVTAMWFFAPHCDVRFDFVVASILNQPASYYALPQLHIYL